MTNETVSPQETQSTDSDDAQASSQSGRSTLDEQGDIAADYLEGLLDILDLDGDIDLDVEADRPLVSVIEANAGDLHHLVGEDGQVLAALQDLTRLAVTNQTGNRARLILDIAGHRSRRRDSLRRIAATAVEEAKANGQPVRMAAMTPFERKVVHDAIAEAGLRTESEGAEPQRYVVVFPNEQ